MTGTIFAVIFCTTIATGGSIGGDSGANYGKPLMKEVCYSVSEQFETLEECKKAKEKRSHLYSTNGETSCMSKSVAVWSKPGPVVERWQDKLPK